MPSARARQTEETTSTRARERAQRASHAGRDPIRGERMPARTASAQLDIREYRDTAAQRHIVSLKGEVDISNGSRVECWIAQVIDDGAKEIVVSLSGLWFIDASGLRSLVACSGLCESCGVRFALTPLRGTVKRVFALTGLDGCFTFTEL